MGLSARGPQAVVRYTLDGSEPTMASPAYTAPLKLTRTTTVKAAAFSVGETNIGSSGSVAATFNIEREVYLSDLAGLDELAHGGMKQDENYDGKAIKLDGHEYAKGLLLCPEPSANGGDGHVTYKLAGGLQNARRFHAVIGIEDVMRGKKHGIGVLYRRGAAAGQVGAGI